MPLAKAVQLNSKAKQKARGSEREKRVTADKSGETVKKQTAPSDLAGITFAYTSIYSSTQ